jgi:hypothetical protein
MSTLTLAAAAVMVLAVIALALGIHTAIRRDARRADQQREKALLKPHAAWLHQHDIDRQFNAMVADLKAGAE